MLTGLSIRNIVLIEGLDLSFSTGLSVLTGETGAGKSILLDSLGLALGARAEPPILRPGTDRGSVAATFEVPASHAAVALLEEHGLMADQTVILRRVIGADGRTRAFVNDESVSVNLLHRIGESLVEIQGQFDERGLMNPTNHRDILDGFGQHAHVKAETRAAYEAWRDAIADRARSAEEAAAARRDEEYLRSALEELETLTPTAGEEKQLAERRALLQNAEALLNALNAGYAEIDGDDGAESKLRAALSHIDRIADKAGSLLDPTRGAIERAVAETQEVMAALRHAADAIELDGQDLETIEERLFTLRSVARKHGLNVDDLPLLRQRIAERLKLVDDQSHSLARLEQREQVGRRRFLTLARTLSDTRRASAKRLDAAVNAEFPPLKLEKASFVTALEELPEGAWGPEGTDRVSFLVTTNPGAPPGPLSRIASGGELSRFMLAIKVALAEVNATPTLVFDEVDSGIGGATADAVGVRLARLAERVQILVVTHSPQVAARGNVHLRVEKREAGSLAVTGVDRLDENARREEVARMLSGRDITDEARAAAGRLLQGER
ncbi:MAG: DNA repair protein RecN [Alphaproteobacteria bacterium]|nr:DNA repair protein RecN [Alphaproteobacteria bacterium]